jgi:hypothetical protein
VWLGHRRTKISRFCVKVTDRHTAIDYAHVLRDLSDTHFPDAAKIVLVHVSAISFASAAPSKIRRRAECFF